MHRVDRPPVAALELLDQDVGGKLADPGARLADRRQTDPADARERDVVEADDAHVARHLHPARLERVDQPDRGQVVAGDDRGRPGRQPKQRTDDGRARARVVAARSAPVAQLELRIDGQARGGESGAIPGDALLPLAREAPTR